MKLQKNCMKLQPMKSASSYYCTTKVAGVRDAAARGARNSRLRLFRPTSRQHHRSCTLHDTRQSRPDQSLDPAKADADCCTNTTISEAFSSSAITAALPPSHGSRPQNNHRALLRTSPFAIHNPPFIPPAVLTICITQVLAIGFLLVILSSALWHNYLPLLVVATYVLAPLPNWICSRCSNPDDFMESSGSAVLDFGRFCTGFLVVMGIGESFDLFLHPFCSRT